MDKLNKAYLKRLYQTVTPDEFIGRKIVLARGTKEQVTEVINKESAEIISRCTAQWAERFLQ